MFSMRVALVEDEKKLRDTLVKGLEAEGYVVSAYPSAETFEHDLALVGDHHFGVLVLDLMLPQRSGLEVCHDLRLKGITVPVLVLSARSAIADKVELLNAGADDYLTKPFSFDELLARLSALTRRPQSMHHKQHVLGPVTLDVDTRIVTRAGVEVSLTSTEFDLFLLLADARGTVVSRDRISRYLWDLESQAVSNLVDVHISNLRKKLNTSHEDDIIHTVRGAGYLIKE